MKKLISIFATLFAVATLNAAVAFNTVLPGNLNVLPGNKVTIGTTNTPTLGLQVVGSTALLADIRAETSADVSPSHSLFQATGNASDRNWKMTSGLTARGSLEFFRSVNNTAVPTVNAFNISSAGNVSITATTASTSSTTGSLIVGNGTAATTVGIGGGNVFVGGGTMVLGVPGVSGNSNVKFAGQSSYDLSLMSVAVDRSFTLQGGASGSPYLFSFANAGAGGIQVSVAGTASLFSCAGTTDATTITTGAITTAGGVGIAKAAFIGTTLNVAGDVQLAKTVTTGGTTGAQTIDKNSGSVNFAGGATTLVVTCNKAATSSIIQLTVATSDATAARLSYTPANGSFTINFGVAPTAETRVNFTITN